jgi:hypothetical protein
VPFVTIFLLLTVASFVAGYIYGFKDGERH